MEAVHSFEALGRFNGIGPQVRTGGSKATATAIRPTNCPYSVSAAEM
jgi:hypothetical protein